MNDNILRRENHVSGLNSTSPGVPQPQSQASTQDGHAGVSFDLSSFDPLQAHAFQLTASAGLGNLLNPSSTGNGISPSSAQRLDSKADSRTNSQVAQHSQSRLPQVEGHGLQRTPSQARQHPQSQNPFYFLSSQPTTTASLQPVASTAQSTPHNSQAGIEVGQAATQSQNLLLHETYGQSGLVTGSLQVASTPPEILPNHLLMFQNVVAVNTPQPQQNSSPMVVAHPSKKRNLECHSASTKAGAQKRRELAPSLVSSSSTWSSDSPNGHPTFSCGAVGMSSATEDIFKESEQDIEKMTPAERRRHERNLREQQRSYRISQQIKELREVLTESNVPFKPNKYSILLSVVDYIKQLQSRAIMLDAEHQKLISTIRETNELVNTGHTPCSGTDETEETNTSDNTNGSYAVSDSDMLFVQGLDYRSLFEQCPAALGIAALDGRILECNGEFQILLGFPKEDLLKQSLFNLVRNHQDIFRAMAQMLKSAEVSMSDGESISSVRPCKSRHWSGPVVSKRNREVRTRSVGDLQELLNVFLFLIAVVYQHHFDSCRRWKP